MKRAQLAKAKALSKRAAFTLVELLVVIAIIALLAALLMPALKSARDRAKTVRCANSLRQISAAFYGYLNDRNGYFPYQWPESSWDPSVLNVVWSSTYNQYWCGAQNAGAGGGTPWSVAIKPYLGTARNTPATTKDSFLSLMQCPANRWPWSNMGFAGVWCCWAQSAPISGYAMNLTMFPASYRCCSIGLCTSCGSATAANPSTPQGWDKRVNISDVQHPAAVALLGEQPVYQNAAYANLYANSLPTWWGISACSATNNNTPVSVAACGGSWGISSQWRYPDCNGYIATWHNLGMNALLVDGHVDWISKPKLFEYSVQATSAAYGPNNTPGGLFWTDGKGMLSQATGWYANQFPGGPWPE